MAVSEIVSRAITSVACRVADRTVSQSIQAITGMMDLFAGAVFEVWVKVRPQFQADMARVLTPKELTP